MRLRDWARDVSVRRARPLVAATVFAAVAAVFATIGLVCGTTKGRRVRERVIESE